MSFSPWWLSPDLPQWAACAAPSLSSWSVVFKWQPDRCSYTGTRRGAVSPNGCRSSVRSMAGPGAPARRGGRNLRLTSSTTLSRKETPDMSTRIRTWLLIAGLTALLIAIGAAIGGGALYIFVGLAVLMNVGGYWFSDRLALRASRAQPVEPGSLPALEADVQELAARAGVPVPRLYLIPSEQPNAFATGRNPQHA